jgi:hypothetical protein
VAALFFDSTRLEVLDDLQRARCRGEDVAVMVAAGAVLMAGHASAHPRACDRIWVLAERESEWIVPACHHDGPRIASAVE